MKVIKYFLAIVLIFSVIFALYACGKKNKTETEKALILKTYGRYWTGIELGMKEFFIPDFKAKTGIDIELKKFNESSETLRAVRLDRDAGKETADFLWIDLMDLPAYMAEDLLMDISDIVAPFKDKLPPNYLKLVTTPDSSIIAVPHHISADFMLYNADEISEDDLPDSYEELLEWAKKNPGKYSYRGKSEGLSTSLMNFLFAFGALGPDKDPAKLFDVETNPEILEVFEYLKELYPYVKQPLYEHNPVFEVDMASGTITLFANWDAELAKVRIDKDAKNVKLHPNIQLKGKGDLRPICSGGWLFAIPKNAAHPKEAKEFIKYMMSVDNQILAIINQQSSITYTAHIPIRSDAIEEIPPTLAKDLFDVDDLSYLVEGTFKNFVNRPTVPYYHDLSIILQDVHNAIVINGEDPKETLARAQKELEAFAQIANQEPPKEGK